LENWRRRGRSCSETTSPAGRGCSEERRVRASPAERFLTTARHPSPPVGEGTAFDGEAQQRAGTHPSFTTWPFLVFDSSWTLERDYSVFSHRCTSSVRLSVRAACGVSAPTQPALLLLFDLQKSINRAPNEYRHGGARFRGNRLKFLCLVFP